MPCFALRRGAGGPGAVGVAFAAPKELFGDRPRALNPTLLTSRGIRDIGAAWEEKPAARVSAAAVAGKAVGLLSSGASAAAAGAVAGDRAPLGRREAAAHAARRGFRSSSDLRAIQEETPEQVVASAGHDEPADFASSAATGRRCKLLSERTGARAEAEYSVDADLARLVLTTSGAAGRRKTQACDVMSIEDIYTLDDGEACFPKHILAALTPEEKAGLCLIVHAAGGPDAGPTEVYLAEASQPARDSLLEHLHDLKHQMWSI